MPSSQIVFNNNFEYVFSQNGSKPFYDGEAIFVPCVGDPSGSTIRIYMYAKVDAQTPWAIQDQVNSPTVGTISNLSVAYNVPGGSIEVGDYIYVFYFKSTDRLMALSRFSKSAKTWEEVATGGPAAVAANNTDAANSALNVQYYNGIFTVPYRAANEIVSSSGYFRTKITRWSVSGWEVSQDTFSSEVSGLAHSCDNISTTLDGSGNVHMLADLRRTPASQSDTYYRTLHQICYANGTLSAVTTLEDVLGTDIVDPTRRANAHASIPEIIGNKIGFGIVRHEGNNAIDPSFGIGQPILGYYAFDPTAPAAITPVLMNVSSATFEANAEALQPSTVVIPAQTRVTGLVTIERRISGTYVAVYHDISDIATNRLIIWVHYPDDVSTDVDPPILYGAYFDDAGLIGSPFEIYRSTLSTTGEVIYQVMHGYGSGVAALTISVADQMVMTDSVGITITSNSGPGGTPSVSECLEIIVASGYCSTWKTADDASPMEAGCTGIYSIDTDPCT